MHYAATLPTLPLETLSLRRFGFGSSLFVLVDARGRHLMVPELCSGAAGGEKIGKLEKVENDAPSFLDRDFTL